MTDTKPLRVKPTEKPVVPREAQIRQTEFYEGYIDGYGGDNRPSTGNVPPRTPQSASNQPLAQTSRARVEDEEGYESAGFERPAVELSEIKYYVRIFNRRWYCRWRLTLSLEQLNCRGDTRALLLPVSTPFEEFVRLVAKKCGQSPTAPRALKLKFEDEDGRKVALDDESDYALALDAAHELAKGQRKGRIEVWVQ